MDDYVCPKCGDTENITSIGSGALECLSCGAQWERSELTYETVYDEPEEGCIACGNPDYPKCKWSCDLIDE